MPLKALKIVEEEIARLRGLGALDAAIAAVEDRLDSLEARIKDRIARECIEQPDPDELKNDCVFCEAGGECIIHAPFVHPEHCLCDPCVTANPEKLKD